MKEATIKNNEEEIEKIKRIDNYLKVGNDVFVLSKDDKEVLHKAIMLYRFVLEG